MKNVAGQFGCAKCWSEAMGTQSHRAGYLLARCSECAGDAVVQQLSEYPPCFRCLEQAEMLQEDVGARRCIQCGPDLEVRDRVGQPGLQVHNFGLDGLVSAVAENHLVRVDDFSVSFLVSRSLHHGLKRFAQAALPKTPLVGLLERATGPLFWGDATRIDLSPTCVLGPWRRTKSGTRVSFESEDTGRCELVLRELQESKRVGGIHSVPIPWDSCGGDALVGFLGSDGSWVDVKRSFLGLPLLDDLDVYFERRQRMEGKFRNATVADFISAAAVASGADPSLTLDPRHPFETLFGLCYPEELAISEVHVQTTTPQGSNNQGEVEMMFASQLTHILSDRMAEGPQGMTAARAISGILDGLAGMASYLRVGPVDFSGPLFVPEAVREGLRRRLWSLGLDCRFDIIHHPPKGLHGDHALLGVDEPVWNR